MFCMSPSRRTRSEDHEITGVKRHSNWPPVETAHVDPQRRFCGPMPTATPRRRGTAGPVRHTLPNGGHQQRCRRHARRPFSITVACLEPVTSFELDDLVVGVRVLAAQAAPRRLSCVIGSLRHPAPAGLVRALRGNGRGVHEDQRVSTLEGGATPASGVRGDREPPSASRSIASPVWARGPVSRDRNLVAFEIEGPVSALVVASTRPSFPPPPADPGDPPPSGRYIRYARSDPGQAGSAAGR